MHKRAAVAAFERALALVPGNLEYRKMLARAQSMSGAEVAYHKVATGVRHGVAAARIVSLLVHLAPLVFLVLSIVTSIFATTPQGQATSLTFFIVSVALSSLFMALGMARRRLAAWYQAHQY
jgi:ABC-type transport system involved in cytochrome c biogenesis permease subunit